MDRLPPLRLLTIFDAVQRHGSMQRAAAEMNVTRPAISQAIKALEDEVGVVLMDRNVKPSAPTEAGERLARATRSGLAQIADAIDDIRFSAGLSDRQVTVSCTLGMATHWLMPRLAHFYAQNPDIRVNVQAFPADLPFFSPGIDIALRYGDRAWDDGWTEKMFDEMACPVACPALMESLSDGKGALVKAPLIHVQAPKLHAWAGWSDYFAKYGLARPQGPKQIFNNYVQAVQAAQDGRGVMLGWHSITDALIDSGRLAALPEGWCDFGTAYWVTCSPESRNSSAAEAFMNWVAEAATLSPA